MKLGIKNRETNVGLKTRGLEDDWRCKNFLICLLFLARGLCHLESLEVCAAFQIVSLRDEMYSDSDYEVRVERN
jgi:hypothetical protein